MRGLQLRLTHIAPLLITLLLCTELRAQATPRISPGDWVRISFSALGGPTEGTVLAVSPTTLVLHGVDNDTVYTSWHDIRRLEIGRGASRLTTAAKYSGLGFLAGGATGALIGYAGYEEPGPSEWCFALCSRKETTLFSGMVIGIITGAAGGIIGALAPEERWERLALPASPQISLQGSAVVVSVPITLP